MKGCLLSNRFNPWGFNPPQVVKLPAVFVGDFCNLFKKLCLRIEGLRIHWFPVELKHQLEHFVTPCCCWLAPKESNL
jgi:hypothetical protein